MKRLNNSQPLAVATQYAPLSTSIYLVTEGGMSLSQYYHKTTNEWMPDHTHAPAMKVQNGVECLSDGPLSLRPEYHVIDPDGLLEDGDLVPQVYWFVNDAQVTSTESTADFYVSDHKLVVRKNFTHKEACTVRCECRFVDTRKNEPFTLQTSVTLNAVLLADEKWSVKIVSDRAQKFFPLGTGGYRFRFRGEARLGNTDMSSATDDTEGLVPSVEWLWTYSSDNGQTWKTIVPVEGNVTEETCLWYVGGKDARDIEVDARYTEGILLRLQIRAKFVSHDSNAAKVLQPCMATASLSWRWPDVRPQVVCYNGDQVRPRDVFKVFGTLIHVAGRSDMTEEEKKEWVMPKWIVRKQGVMEDGAYLGSCGQGISVDANLLRSKTGVVYVVDADCVMRGALDAVAVGGEPIAVRGEVMCVRG